MSWTNHTTDKLEHKGFIAFQACTQQLDQH